MKRSEAREKVFQTLFQMDFYEDFRERYEGLISEQGIKGAQLPYALNSVKGVLDNIEKIDIDISSNLKGWTIDRLTKTALTILRLGIFEAFYNEDIAPLIAIDEAVKLGYRYCDEKEANFINGLLNKIYQESLK